MSRPKPQWQLQALAAQKRDNELRRTEELKRVANYFESNTNKSRHHEQWTTEDYYERANRESEILHKKKMRAVWVFGHLIFFKHLIFNVNKIFVIEILIKE